MVHINRNAVPPPAILADPEGKGHKEIKALIEFYSKKRNQGKGLPKKLTAYSHHTVHVALQQLCYEKCAYCESRYLHTTPDDVEHWRPKGRITTPEGKQIPGGYYWLAATWENLFPSCNKCNRRMEHIELPSGNRRVLGKQDRFPLLDESKRARAPGEEVNEEPLLINPCLDDPADHLFFPRNHSDQSGVLQARLLSSGEPSLKGTTSIEHYALNRAELVQERKAHFILIQKQLSRIRRLIFRLQNAKGTPSYNEELAEFKEELAALHEFLQPKKQFVQLSSQLIFPFLESLRREAT